MLLLMQFIGHLGKDCVVNQVNGKTVINFNVANTQKYQDAQGTKHERTTWISCSYWVNSSGIAAYLKKGQLVYVQGQPGAEWFNNSRSNADGITAILKCNVREVNLLGGSKNNSNGEQSNRMPDNANHITEPIDDLPF